MKTFDVTSYAKLVELMKLLKAGKRPKHIIAYKYVLNGQSPIAKDLGFKALNYRTGKTYRAKVCTDTSASCGSGINVAHRQWCEGMAAYHIRWCCFRHRSLQVIKLELLGKIVIPTYIETTYTRAGNVSGHKLMPRAKFRCSGVKVLS